MKRKVMWVTGFRKRWRARKELKLIEQWVVEHMAAEISGLSVPCHTICRMVVFESLTAREISKRVLMPLDIILSYRDQALRELRSPVLKSYLQQMHDGPA